MYIVQRQAGRPTIVQRATLLSMAAVLLGIVAFANLPGTTLFWQGLQDFAHAPAFAVLSWILMRLRKPPGATSSTSVRYLGSLATCVILGIAVELLQASIGRDASAKDVFTDLLGSGSGLAAYACLMDRGTSSNSRRIRILTSLSVLGAATAAAPVAWLSAAYLNRDRNFPVLAEFHSRLDLAFLSGTEPDTAIRALTPSLTRREDESGLRVALGSGPYSGVSIDEPWPNWSRYRTLAVDLANPGDRSLLLHLRVHDRQHDQALDDRFNRSLTLPPRSRETWHFPLAEIQAAPATRAMNMTSLAGIVLFARGTHVGETFYLQGVWLE